MTDTQDKINNVTTDSTNEFNLLVSESIQLLRKVLKDDAKSKIEIQHLSSETGQHQAKIALKILELAQLNGNLR